MKQKHCWSYFAFNQTLVDQTLVEGRTVPAVLLPC